MTEYTKHLETYLNYPYSSFSELITPNDWGNKKLAEKYLMKYWLNEKDYIRTWKPIQDQIFYQDKGLPQLVYKPNFNIIPLIGGCLFIEEEFIKLQNIMKSIGNKNFVIIQSSQNFTIGEPMFRMRFPVDITWTELISGNYISAVLLEMNYNEYFVFSESGDWGKYAANDYDFPLDIIGFKPELGSIFKKNFTQSIEDFKKINSSLPNDYKKLII